MPPKTADLAHCFCSFALFA